MRYELRSIGIWTFIKVSFLFNLVVGFILGLLYVPFLALIASMGEMYPIIGLDPVTFEISGAWMVLLPLLFAIMGAFINTTVGLALVFIYNMIAALLGGLEVRLVPVDTGGKPLVNERPPMSAVKVPTPPADSPPSPGAPPAHSGWPIGTPPPPPPPGRHETGGKEEA